jgi:hypothetical protein
MEALGVARSRIAGLLEAHAADRVLAWVLEVEALCGGNGRAPRNPAGLLVTALREGWEPPPSGRRGGKADRDRRRLTVAIAEARVFLPDVDRARAAVDEQWPGRWEQVAGELGVSE